MEYKKGDIVEVYNSGKKGKIIGIVIDITPTELVVARREGEIGLRLSISKDKDGIKLAEASLEEDFLLQNQGVDWKSINFQEDYLFEYQLKDSYRNGDFLINPDGDIIIFRQYIYKTIYDRSGEIEKTQIDYIEVHQLFPEKDDRSRRNRDKTIKIEEGKTDKWRLLDLPEELGKTDKIFERLRNREESWNPDLKRIETNYSDPFFHHGSRLFCKSGPMEGMVVEYYKGTGEDTFERYETSYESNLPIELKKSDWSPVMGESSEKKIYNQYLYSFNGHDISKVKNQFHYNRRLYVVLSQAPMMGEGISLTPLMKLYCTIYDRLTGLKYDYTKNPLDFYQNPLFGGLGRVRNREIEVEIRDKFAFEYGIFKEDLKEYVDGRKNEGNLDIDYIIRDWKLVMDTSPRFKKDQALLLTTNSLNPRYVIFNRYTGTGTTAILSDGTECLVKDLSVPDESLPKLMRKLGEDEKKVLLEKMNKIRTIPEREEKKSIWRRLYEIFKNS